MHLIRPIFLLWLLAASLFSPAARASCGLDHCSTNVSTTVQADNRFHLVTRSRFTTPRDVPGWYSETFLGGVVSLGTKTQLGVMVPSVLVGTSTEVQWGLGNAVASIDRSLLSRKNGAVVAALQAELPTRTSDSLGDGHFFFLPYLHGSYALGAVDLAAMAGWGLQPGGAGHSHAAAHHGGMGFEVNPHASSELVWRVSAGISRAWERFSLRPGLGLDGVQEWVDHQDTVVAGIPSLDLQVGRLVIHGEVQVPLTETQRFGRRGILSLSVPLGG